VVKSIWLVSSGEYSHYGVHAAFATEELAQAHADLLTGQDAHRDKPFLEELAFFDRPPERRTWYEAELNMFTDGKTSPNEEHRISERDTWEYEMPRGISERPRVKLLFAKGYREKIRVPDTRVMEPGAYRTSDGFMYIKSAKGKRRPGQYGLFVEGLDRRAIARILIDTEAQWRAQGYKLNNAEAWR
jgi:hypothetical protein